MHAKNSNGSDGWVQVGRGRRVPVAARSADLGRSRRRPAERAFLRAHASYRRSDPFHGDYGGMPRRWVGGGRPRARRRASRVFQCCPISHSPSLGARSIGARKILFKIK
jgi:hypothetical protein